MFFFEEDGREYFKTLTCTNSFKYTASNNLEAQCYAGPGETWGATLALGDKKTLFIYQLDSFGKEVNNSYMYIINKTTGDENSYYADYLRISSTATYAAKPAHLRRANIEKGILPPAQNSDTWSAAGIGIGRKEAQFFGSRLNLPLVNVYLNGESLQYEIQMDILSAEPNIDFRIVNITEKSSN